MAIIQSMRSLKTQKEVGSHKYKPKIDNRLKLDKDFKKFEKELQKRFDAKAEEFVQEMERLREETENHWKIERNRVDSQLKKKQKRDEARSQKYYHKAQEVKKRFIEFMRKRQAFLESKKKGILNKKSWQSYNLHYRQYLGFIEEKKQEIKKFYKAFDWRALDEHDMRIRRQLRDKKMERKKRDVVRSMDVSSKLYKNKKAYERVIEADKFSQRHITRPKMLADKRKQYAELVRKRFKPAASKKNIDLTQKMRAEIEESMKTVKERRKAGLMSISNSRAYLDYSRKIGQKSLRHSASLTALKMRLQEPSVKAGVDQTTGGNTTLSSTAKLQKVGREYLDHVVQLNKTAQAKRKEVNLEDRDNIFEYRPLRKPKTKKSGKKGKTDSVDEETSKSISQLFTRKEKTKLRAEIQKMDQEFEMKQSINRMVVKGKKNRLEAQKQADDLLIKSMIAKCALSDVHLDPSTNLAFKKPEKVYGSPKKGLDYKKTRFKVTQKRRDRLIKEYREKKGLGGNGGPETADTKTGENKGPGDAEKPKNANNEDF